MDFATIPTLSVRLPRATLVGSKMVGSDTSDADGEDQEVATVNQLLTLEGQAGDDAIDISVTKARNSFIRMWESGSGGARKTTKL
jgi:hypothetical protein